MTTPSQSQLRYQPALPIPNGKFALWLFLSTEIMFFTGLIGTYIVLRFGAPEGTWPSPQEVHVVEWIGAVNTFILLCSSATIVMAFENARQNLPAVAKKWLIATIVFWAAVSGHQRLRVRVEISTRDLPAIPTKPDVRSSRFDFPRWD